MFSHRTFMQRLDSWWSGLGGGCLQVTGLQLQSTNDLAHAAQPWPLLIQWEGRLMGHQGVKRGWLLTVTPDRQTQVLNWWMFLKLSFQLWSPLICGLTFKAVTLSDHRRQQNKVIKHLKFMTVYILTNLQIQLLITSLQFANAIVM